MEILFSALAYGAVFGAAAALAIIPGVIVYFLLKKSLGKGLSYFIGVVLVLCVLLSLSRDPMVLYDQACEQNMSAQQEEAVLSVSSGVYSTRLPLITLAVRVEEVSDGYVCWTQYFFPGGNRVMEYSADGFNCIKPLH